MKRSRRAWMMIAAGALAIIALVGVAVARGKSSPVQQVPGAQRSPTAQLGVQHGVGTIRLDESTLPDGDTAEALALQRLAKVSRGDAEAAALKAVPGGTVIDSELDTEDGFVVWEVDLVASDGTSREVNVDAGDAKVLDLEIDD